MSESIVQSAVSSPAAPLLRSDYHGLDRSDKLHQQHHTAFSGILDEISGDHEVRACTIGLECLVIQNPLV